MNACGYVIVIKRSTGHGYSLSDMFCTREEGHIGHHVYEVTS